jgi:hypothetical protein
MVGLAGVAKVKTIMMRNYNFATRGKESNNSGYLPFLAVEH